MNKNILASGIDVSIWQKDFDMSRAKAEGFTFVIAKGGGTLADGAMYVDPQFESNYKKAKALGMNVGAYFYSRATDEAAARAEAEYFYDRVIKGRQFDLPVYVDIEERAQLALGARRLTDVAHAFCQTLEERGCWAGIYSSLSYFKTKMIDSELQRYAHWIACWATDCIYDGECFGIWQYGGETNPIRSNQVAGVTCDQNYLLVDYPPQIKASGLNGYTKPSAPIGKSDVNGDGMLSAKDLSAEMKAIAAGSKDAAYDINGNGRVDTKDLTALMKKMSK